MSSNIKVIVRPRPIDESKKEKWAGGFEIQRNKRITLGQRVYDPDTCLDPATTNEEVFEQCLGPIEAVRQGNNGTIMVYGQTGTGKTHSMFGAGPEDISGVTFKSIEALLTDVQDGTREGRKMALSCAILELYNEKFGDLLDEGSEVTLMNGFPRNCKKVVLPSISFAHALVQKAVSKRHVASTSMNDRSSRSHLVVLLELAEETAVDCTTSAHLYLVDLAGSESIKKSGVSGKQAQEAGMINKSLLALKNVVLTLSSHSQEGPRPHVPYRDSRLTEILQDSVGGTARTCLVACVSPLGRDIEETKNTLEYATKARSIRNVQDRDKLHFKIRNLEVENEKLRNKISLQANDRGTVTINKEELDDLEAMKEELALLREDANKMSAQIDHTEAKTAINESHVAITLEMLKASEKELEVCKAKWLQETLKVNEVVRQMQAVGCAGLRELQNHHQEHLDRLSRNVTDISLDSGMFKAEVQTIVDSFNEKVVANLAEITTLGEELESDVIQDGAELEEDLVAFEAHMAQQHLANQASLKEIREKAKNRHLRRAGDAKGKLDFVFKKMAHVPLIDGMPFEHAVDNLVHHFQSEKATSELTNLTLTGNEPAELIAARRIESLDAIACDVAGSGILAVGSFANFNDAAAPIAATLTPTSQSPVRRRSSPQQQQQPLQHRRSVAGDALGGGGANPTSSARNPPSTRSTVGGIPSSQRSTAAGNPAPSLSLASGDSTSTTPALNLGSSTSTAMTSSNNNTSSVRIPLSARPLTRPLTPLGTNSNAKNLQDNNLVGKKRTRSNASLGIGGGSSSSFTTRKDEDALPANRRRTNM